MNKFIPVEGLKKTIAKAQPIHHIPLLVYDMLLVIYSLNAFIQQVFLLFCYSAVDTILRKLWKIIEIKSYITDESKLKF